MCELIGSIAIACDGKFSLTYFLKFSLKPDDSDLSGARADRDRALRMAQPGSACHREVLDFWDFMMFVSFPLAVKEMEFQDIPHGTSGNTEVFSGVSSRLPKIFRH